MQGAEFAQDIAFGGIGSEAAYFRLRQAKPNLHVIYLGNRIPQHISEGICPILLDADYENLTECVQNMSSSQLAFWHNGHLLFPNSEALFEELRNAYLSEHAFLQLKELNLLQIVSEILLKKTELRSLPSHIQLEHTSFCNARCIMCDHYVAHNRGAKHLLFSSVKHLERILPFVQLIVMHGNGEPLLNPEIVPLMRMYSSYGVRLSLNTNLSFLTEEILTLLRSSCQTLHVSCDGCSQAQYESIRLGLRFHTLLDNLRKIELYAPDINRILEVVLMRRNIASAVDFVNFAAEHGFHTVRFNKLGVNELIGNGSEAYLGTKAKQYIEAAKERGLQLGVKVITPSESSLLTEQSAYLQHATEPVFDLSHSNQIHHDNPQFENTISCWPLPECMLDEALHPHVFSGVCEYPFAKTYIDLLGNISFCCPASRMPIGRITEEQPFETIWNCSQYQSLRRRFYMGKFPRLCEGCFLLDTGSLQFFSDRR